MRLSILLCSVFAFGALALPAHADYFVWQDPKTGVSLSFPDTWRTINNQKTDDLVTIIGPSQDDRPICRLRARTDKRYTVYPVWYSADVQRVAYGQDFWDTYTADYNNVQVHSYKDDAGLGKAFASMLTASFTEPGGADHTLMRSAVMWAGVYYDTAYVLDCSSTHASFEKWSPDFVSIAHTVDMRKVVHELATGDYRRNFLNDKYLTHPVVNDKDKMGQTFN